MIPEETVRQAAAANVAAALAEDVGAGDVSAQLIADDAMATARVITRDAGIFCGQPWVDATLAEVDSRAEVEWHVADGDVVQAGQTLFTLTGPARSLLTAERTMLNFVQLLSGTATKTAEYVSLVADTHAAVLDTRKTVPGLRIAQKHAVACGGGKNHRLGLYDAYLLKENHIAASGSIGAAVTAARDANPAMPVEVEVETLDQLKEALDAGADIAMVDNFTLAQTREAVALADGRIKLEASGGIDETSITDIAETGVDYISIGKLTKDVDPLDLSMRFID
jgi:nicotinate-nucleotide pyrophosphorylase (carboxylating)